MTQLTPSVLLTKQHAIEANEAIVARARAALVALDSKEKGKELLRRAALLECKVCYYLRGPRVAGRGFTDYKCGICEASCSHTNTSVPKYCAGCCLEHSLCGRCGGPLETKP